MSPVWDTREYISLLGLRQISIYILGTHPQLLSRHLMMVLMIQGDNILNMNLRGVFELNS